MRLPAARAASGSVAVEEVALVCVYVPTQNRHVCVCVFALGDTTDA